MRSLRLGGERFSCPWSEKLALPCFPHLRSLALFRRNRLGDDDLAPALAALTNLRSLSLSGCASITDAALLVLSPGLECFSAVLCERLEGEFLARLARLRELRLLQCRALLDKWLAVAVAANPRLTRVEVEGLDRVGCSRGIGRRGGGGL